MFVLDTNVVSELRKVKAGKADRNVAAWAATVPANTLFVSKIIIRNNIKYNDICNRNLFSNSFVIVSFNRIDSGMCTELPPFTSTSTSFRYVKKTRE